MGLTTTPQLFPDRMCGWMQYASTLGLAPAVGTTAYNVFRANSVFDPDLTGTGGTVVGYSSAIGLYNAYRVTKFRFWVECTSGNATPLVFFVVASPTNTLGTSIATITSQRHVWMKSSGGNGGLQVVNHHGSFPIHSIYGSTAQQVLIEDDFEAVAGANPNNAVYLHVGAYAPTGSVAGDARISFRLEYFTHWRLPIGLS